MTMTYNMAIEEAMKRLGGFFGKIADEAKMLRSQCGLLEANLEEIQQGKIREVVKDLVEMKMKVNFPSGSIGWEGQKRIMVSWTEETIKNNPGKKEIGDWILYLLNLIY